MKVTTEVVVPVFVPVSITFETREELAEFVGKQGKLSPIDSGLSFEVWERLDKHLDDTADF